MYDFDEIIDRQHTNALSTDGFRGYIFHAGPEKVFPYKDDEFVRMWVADMDFGVAPEILDEMRKRIDRRIFGYTGVYDHDYYNSFAKWCKDHYDWEFPEEELCFSPGIIPALYQLTETLCTPDEKVLINTPAYGYFLHAAEYAHVEPIYSPLKSGRTVPLCWMMRTLRPSAPIPSASWSFGAIRRILPAGCGRRRSWPASLRSLRNTTSGLFRMRSTAT